MDKGTVSFCFINAHAQLWKSVSFRGTTGTIQKNMKDDNQESCFWKKKNPWVGRDGSEHGEETGVSCHKNGRRLHCNRKGHREKCLEMQSDSQRRGEKTREFIFRGCCFSIKHQVRTGH